MSIQPWFCKLFVCFNIHIKTFSKLFGHSAGFPGFNLFTFESHTQRVQPRINVLPSDSLANCHIRVASWICLSGGFNIHIKTFSKFFRHATGFPGFNLFAFESRTQRVKPRINVLPSGSLANCHIRVAS